MSRDDPADAPAPEVPASASDEPTAAPRRTRHHRADGRERTAGDNNPRFPHPMLFLGVVIAVTVIALAIHRVEPAQPDSFYTPPSPLPAGAPGTIIAQQPVTGAPAGSQAWTILYLSTGLQNQPIAVSGVVFVPTAPPPAGAGGRRPVLAWAHPTTGVAPRCAPSLEAAGGAASIPGLATFLAAGYVVTATDYPGLGTAGPHPYLVGQSEGVAVLDSVRAAGNLQQAEAGSQFAVWGHSQGGHAALFAGQLAPTYAPELTLVGIAAAAPATDLSALLQKDIGGLTGNVLGSMAVVSWSQVYAAQGLQLGQVVQPQSVPAARLIADYCIETESQVVVDLPEAEVLTVAFLANAPWSTPGWDTELATNTPGAVAIKAPVLVNQGTADTVVWPNVTAAYVAAQCTAGVNMTEKTYPNVTHTDIAKDSAGDAATWLAARFQGTPAPNGCGAAAAG
jgi:alpha-beta hydrolase superfamily lysophospholipase